MPIRFFESGATRDTEEGKLDYEAFLSPQVLERYAEYMDKNQVRADGTRRDGDDWQKGIPRTVYMKSAWRHLMDVWFWHRELSPKGRTSLEEALCGVLFNVMGYLFEVLQEKRELPECEADLLREKYAAQE